MPQGPEDATTEVEPLRQPAGATAAGQATRILLPVACTLVVGLSLVSLDAVLDLSHSAVAAVLALVTIAVALSVGTLLLLLRRSRAAEAHLADRASFISTLLDTVDVAVVSCDEKGSIKLLNKRAQEYLGISKPTGLKPADWANAYGMYKPGSSEPLTVEEQPIVKALRQGTVRNEKLEVRVDGRVERVVVINGRALHDSRGALTGAVVSGQDVTELDRAQRSLNDEADRLRQTVSVQQAIVGEVDDFDATVQSAAVWARQLGGGDTGVFETIEGDEFCYRGVSGVLEHQLGLRVPVSGSLSGVALRTGATQLCVDTHRDDRVARALTDELGIRSMIVTPVRHRGSDIGVLKVSSSKPSGFDSAAIARIESVAASVGSALAVSKLLTDNRQLFARSEEQRDVYERLLTALSDVGEGVTIGEGDRFVYANKAFCDLTGFSEDELLAMASSSEMVLDTDQDRWSKLRSDVDAGKPVGINEALIRHKTGEPVAIEFSSKQVRVGGVVQRINVIRDVRMRRQWEDSLAERAEVLLRANNELQQLQEARADFLAAVSHDFRTPLTSIVGFTSLVIEQADDATIGGARNYLERIQAASDELRRRVDTFLDYSRAENSELELNCAPGDVADVVQEVLANLAPALTGRHVETRLTPRSFANVEERSLARVVENLITNAIKYSAPDSPLKIEVSPVRGGIEVSVADRGYGIPSTELDLVFDSYFRSPEVKGNIRGSGIGLAVVRQLVEAMGGSVSAKNRDGGGTIFSVHLASPHVSAL